jgi:prevent-host-death family protein
MCYGRVVPDIHWRSEDDWEVSVRELRNHTSEVLRRVEAGEPATVTVDKRPVARLVPLRWEGRPRFMPTAELFARLAEIGGGADPGLRDELREMLPGTTDDLKIWGEYE